MSYNGFVRHVEHDPNSYGCASRSLDGDEQAFFRVRDLEGTEVIVSTSDPKSAYDYNDWQLVHAGGEFWVFETSGCSCPSPDETWSLVFRGDDTSARTWLAERRSNVAEYQTGEREFLSKCAEAGW